MDLETLQANSVGITNMELEKQRLLEDTYHKMVEGKALAPEHVTTLNDYTRTADKLQKAKNTNMTIESLMDSRKFAGDECEDGEKEEKEKKSEEKGKFPPKKEENQEEKPEKEEKSDESSEDEGEEGNEKEANFADGLNEEEILLGSLLKDTPTGNYSNTLAKMRAESDLDRQNYTNAFNALQNKGRENFQYLLKSDSELSHPDRINTVNQNFQLLNEFAPALAANPITARSFLRKMDAYGDQIDEKTIGELIKTNSEFMNHRVRMN